MARKVLLTLDTMAKERDIIKIAGKDFEVRSAEEMSLTEQAEMIRLGKAIQGIESDPAAATLALNAFVKAIIVDLDDKTLESLKDAQKVKIVGAFNQAAGTEPNPEPSAGDDGAKTEAGTKS